MKRQKFSRRFENADGAALPTVLLVSVLLVTASAALITAVSSSAVNSTDALSESKAYYAAESGIQAAVHVLRNNGVNYKDAVNFTGGDLSTWISDYSVGANGESYSLKVSDPDNAQTHIDFVTDAVGTNAGFSKDGLTYTQTIEYVDAVDSTKKTIISWQGFSPDPAIAFGGNPAVISGMGGFKVTNENGGSPINTIIHFRVNLRLAAADNPTWVLKGTITPPSATPALDIKFVSYGYRMVGSDLWLCASTGTCPSTAPTAFAKTLDIAPTGSEAVTDFAVRLTPMEPTRLLLKSTGVGPNGARKQLEAMIHKTFFPAVPPAAGILLNGPNASFDNGNGKPQYRGCDPYNPAVCVPSIGVTDPGSLPGVQDPSEYDPPPNGHPLAGSPNPDPPPALVGEDLPLWQQSPSAMDQMIKQWEFFASQTPGAIKPNNATLGTGTYGDFATGLGLTVCSGNCTLNGDGGGILIVKGKLTTSGGISFKGMVLVVGTDGVLRNGNGGADDQIIGSLIISPYTLNPDAWLSPQFAVNGGGTSVVTYSGLDYLFDGGITGASNFVSGVAEK